MTTTRGEPSAWRRLHRPRLLRRRGRGARAIAARRHRRPTSARRYSSRDTRTTSSPPDEGRPTVDSARFEGLLDGGTETEYFADICAGDTLTVVCRLENLEVRDQPDARQDADHDPRHVHQSGRRQRRRPTRASNLLPRRDPRAAMERPMAIIGIRFNEGDAAARAEQAPGRDAARAVFRRARATSTRCTTMATPRNRSSSARSSCTVASSTPRSASGLELARASRSHHAASRCQYRGIYFHRIDFLCRGTVTRKWQNRAASSLAELAYWGTQNPQGKQETPGKAGWSSSDPDRRDAIPAPTRPATAAIGKCARRRGRPRVLRSRSAAIGASRTTAAHPIESARRSSAWHSLGAPPSARTTCGEALLTEIRPAGDPSAARPYRRNSEDALL